MLSVPIPILLGGVDGISSGSYVARLLSCQLRHLLGIRGQTPTVHVPCVGRALALTACYKRQTGAAPGKDNMVLRQFLGSSHDASGGSQSLALTEVESFSAHSGESFSHGQPTTKSYWKHLGAANYITTLATAIGNMTRRARMTNVRR